MSGVSYHSRRVPCPKGSELNDMALTGRDGSKRELIQAQGLVL